MEAMRELFLKVISRCDLPVPSPTLEVAICDLQSPSSSFVSWNMKLSGKRLALRFTCSFRQETDYTRAANGHKSDLERTGNGLSTDEQRTKYVRDTDLKTDGPRFGVRVGSWILVFRHASFLSQSGNTAL